MKKIPNLLKWGRVIIKAGIPILVGYFTFIRRYAKHKIKYPLEKRYAKLRVLVIKILIAFRADIYAKGEEVLSKINRQTLIVGNHQSILDMLSLIALSPRPISFVAKKEIKKYPFAGKACESIDCLFLDRDDPKQAIRLYRDAANAMKEKGLVYALYPEGTRNKTPLNGKILPFHDGAFKIRQWADADLMMVSTFGTFRPSSRRGNKKSYPFRLSFASLLPSSFFIGKPTSEIASYCHQIIAKEVEEIHSLDQEEFPLLSCKKPTPLLKRLLKEAKYEKQK